MTSFHESANVRYYLDPLETLPGPGGSKSYCAGDYIRSRGDSIDVCFRLRSECCNSCILKEDISYLQEGDHFTHRITKIPRLCGVSKHRRRQAYQQN